MRVPRCRSAVVSGEWAVRTPITRSILGVACCYGETGRFTLTGFGFVSANSLKTRSLDLGNSYGLLRSIEQGKAPSSTCSDHLPRMPGHTCGLTDAGAQLFASCTNAPGKNREAISAFPHRAMMLRSKTPFAWDENGAGVDGDELVWRTVRLALSAAA